MQRRTEETSLFLDEEGDDGAFKSLQSSPTSSTNYYRRETQSTLTGAAATATTSTADKAWSLRQQPRWTWSGSRLPFYPRLFVVLGGAFIILFLLFYHNSPSDLAISSTIGGISGGPSFDISHQPSPFSGRFSHFSTQSQLPEKYKRLTIVSVWNGDNTPSYLRHFFYSAQLNRDAIDVLFINKRQTERDNCIDFKKAKIDIEWGGNIKTYCMTYEEWINRHADVMCLDTTGWNCTTTDRAHVITQLKAKDDSRNVNWRPLVGYAVRDLFANPDIPLWAYMDVDLNIGRFTHYPFNILAGLSFLTGHHSSPEIVFNAGQFTAFNFDDERIASAWKSIPSLQSPQAFNASTPRSTCERFWSWALMNSEDGLPGAQLSYAIYSDLNGDDNDLPDSNSYVISGRDILVVEDAYSKDELEVLLDMERRESIDELGGIGWTGGIDGSELLIEDPELEAEEAKQNSFLRAGLSTTTQPSPLHKMHTGLLESVKLQHGQKCIHGGWIPFEYRQCIPSHPMTNTRPPILRTTLIHFREQAPGYLLRRLERDPRPRGYSRKLFKHHHNLKSLVEFPPFDVTEDMMMIVNRQKLEVFKIGEPESIYFRKVGEDVAI